MRPRIASDGPPNESNAAFHGLVSGLTPNNLKIRLRLE